MSPPGTTHEAVQKELQGERAAALARATERLEAALRQLTAADDALARRPGEPRRTARDEALAFAGERLWYLIIQREAIGLTRHAILDDVLGIPRQVHAAMGPRRRGDP